MFENTFFLTLISALSAHRWPYDIAVPQNEAHACVLYTQSYAAMHIYWVTKPFSRITRQQAPNKKKTEMIFATFVRVYVRPFGRCVEFSTSASCSFTWLCLYSARTESGHKKPHSNVANSDGWIANLQRATTKNRSKTRTRRKKILWQKEGNRNEHEETKCARADQRASANAKETRATHTHTVQMTFAIFGCAHRHKTKGATIFSPKKKCYQSLESMWMWMSFFFWLPLTRAVRC